MFRFCSQISQKELDAFVERHTLANVMQTSSWAQVKSEWSPIYCGVYENKQLIAAALLLKRKLGPGMYLGYIPRGPVLSYEREELCHFFFNAMRLFAKKEHIITLQFDPCIYKSFDIHDKEAAKECRFDNLTSMLASCGCQHGGYALDMYAFTQPRFQVCKRKMADVDLYMFPKKTQDKIQSAKQHCIHIAEKGILDVNEFHRMVAYTEQRKGIMLRDTAYFHRILEAFAGKSVLLFAYLNQKELYAILQNQAFSLKESLQALGTEAHKKRDILEKQLQKIQKEQKTVTEDLEQFGEEVLVSALLLVRDETTTELLYSGLDSHYKQYYAPYVLREKAIDWAFEQGCSQFNFGGVQGSLDDGLFEFKSAFHPQIDVYIGEFFMPIQPVLHTALRRLIPFVKQVKLKLAKQRSTT